MNKVHEIVSDRDMVVVHANAHFGNMTMRRVLAEGVVKAAMGWDFGSTQFHILREHKLITKDKALTKKGKRYARALWIDGEFTLS